MSEAAETFGTSAAYPRLPCGRHGLGAEYVADYQRRRLTVAVAELAHEEGIAAVTVTALTKRAKISRKTFYDVFANREECAEYASEQAASYLFGSLGEIEPGEPATERVDAAVSALLGAVAAEPKLAELALIHAPALGGARGRRSLEIALGGVAAVLAKPAGSETLGSETIASAIIGVIASQIRRGEAEQVEELAEDVVRLARLPGAGVDGL